MFHFSPQFIPVILALPDRVYALEVTDHDPHAHDLIVGILEHNFHILSCLRRTYPRLDCLQLCDGVVNGERETAILAIFALLKTFLELSDANGSGLQVLEISEQRGSLVQYDTLEDLFPLIGEKVIPNGKVYDTATEPEEREKKLAERRALKTAERGPVYKMRPNN
ncbi:hypothetical protein C8R44DRAFT_886297 [Mycena epipterygia]|nr:hypothetical protein C8R44DRAFT_886297 [Mycena epipterygia]